MKKVLVLLLIFITFQVLAVPQMAVEINPNPPANGEAVDVQISLSNAGTSTSGNLSVELVWPQYLNGYSANERQIGGGSCGNWTGSCDTGDILYWDTSDLGSLSPGQSQLIGVNSSVNGSPADGADIDFIIRLYENGSLRQTINQSITVESGSDLDLAVDPQTDPVAPGVNLVYNVAYGNHSSSQATNANLSFPLPVGASFVSATGSGVLNGSVVEWNLGTLPANSNGHQQVTLAIDGGLGDGEQLVIDSAELTATIDFLSQSVHGMATSHIKANETLQFSMEINPDPIEPGETFDIQLKLTNVGLTNENLTKLRFLCTNYMYSHGATWSGACYPGEFLTWSDVSLGILPPGESLTVSANSSVEPNTTSGRIIPFEAMLFVDGVWRNSISHSIAVNDNSGLDLAVDPQSDPVTHGENLIYNLTYGNHSSSQATNANLSFPLPVGASFVSATGSGVLNGSVVEWNLGTLPANSNGHQQVTLAIDGGLGDGEQLVIDSAELTATIDFLPQSAHGMASSHVKFNEPLQFSMEINPNPIEPGEAFDIQLKVTNTGLVIEDLSKMNFMCTNYMNNYGANWSGACNPGEIFTWSSASLGVLPPGESLIVSINSNILSNTFSGRVISFEATLFAGGVWKNSTSHSIVVNGSSGLDLAIDPQADPVAPGANLVYNLTYGNHSSSQATNANLSFPLPTGTSFVSATGGGVLNGDHVEWQLGNLISGEGGRQQIIIQPDVLLPNGHMLTIDNAVLSANINNALQSAHAMAANEVSAQVDIGLDLMAWPNPVGTDSQLSMLIEVSNEQNFTSDNLYVRVLWPNYMDTSPTVSNGGSCGPSCGAFGNYEYGSYVVWDASDLGVLPPQGNLNLSVQEDTYYNVAHGRVIPFEVEVYEGGVYRRTISDSVLVGDFTDFDNDGVADVFDDDDDDDGMPDWWEELYGFNPLNPIDAGQDPDHDFITNLDEYLGGTNPLVSDLPDLIFEDGFEG